jgi:hypothetical protein
LAEINSFPKCATRRRSPNALRLAWHLMEGNRISEKEPKRVSTRPAFPHEKQRRIPARHSIFFHVPSQLGTRWDYAGMVCGAPRDRKLPLQQNPIVPHPKTRFRRPSRSATRISHLRTSMLQQKHRRRVWAVSRPRRDVARETRRGRRPPTGREAKQIW